MAGGDESKAIMKNLRAKRAIATCFHNRNAQFHCKASAIAFRTERGSSGLIVTVGHGFPPSHVPWITAFVATVGWPPQVWSLNALSSL